jgi:hypothetical protein
MILAVYCKIEVAINPSSSRQNEPSVSGGTKGRDKGTGSMSRAGSIYYIQKKDMWR